MPALARRSCLALGLVSCVAVFSEVVLTRVLTGVLYDRLHYLPISGAVLGLGAGAIAPRGRYARIDAEIVLALGSSLGFAVMFILTVLCSDWWVGGAQRPGAVGRFLVSREPLVIAYSALTVFLFYGLGRLTATLYSTVGVPGNSLYAFDLTGAALGAVLAIPALNHLELVECFLVAPLGLTLCLSFYRGASGAVRVLLICEVVAAILIGVAHGPHLTSHVLRTVIDQPRRVYSRWSSAAYMEMYERQPGLWVINQDHGSTVFVAPYDPAAACSAFHAGCEPGLTVDLVRAIREPQSVCVLAAGTGQQMIQFRRIGVPDVVGVEVNPFLMPFADAVAPSAGLRNFVNSRGVHLIADEGRHFMERSRSNYDVILVPSVFAAFQQTVAAHSYLVTEEAVRSYVSHLTSGGLLLFVMPELPGFTEATLDQTRDFLTLIDAGLKGLGISASASVLGILSEAAPGSPRAPLQYVLVAARAFSPREADSLRHLVSVISPGSIAADQSWSNASWIKANAGPAALYRVWTWREMTDRALWGRVEARTIRDDSPWLFERPMSLAGAVDLRAMSRGDPRALQLCGNVVAILGVAVLVILPVRRRRKSCVTPPASLLTFFFLLGFGFMVVEICLIERVDFLTGHVTLGVAMGLGALLVGSGLGSLLSAHLWVCRRPAVVLCALVGVVLVLWLLGYSFRHVGSGLPFTSIDTGTISVSLLPLGVGVFLGVPFPNALALVRGANADWVSWALAFNCAGAVLGTNVVGLLSGTSSFSGMVFLGSLSYAMSVPAAVVSFVLRPQPPLQG